MAPSLIWSFFTKIDNDHASCNFCKAKLSGKRGNTSNYKRHMSSHPTELDKLQKAEAEREQELTSTPSAKRRQITETETAVFVSK